MFKKGKLVTTALVMALVAIAALACSQPAPAPAPTIDTDAIAQQAAAAAAAAVAEQQQSQMSADEIAAMVQSAMSDSMMGMSESVSAEEIQELVEAAVASAADEGASPEELQAMIEGAVDAATADAVTGDDVADAIAMAVSDAQANMLTSEDVQAAVMEASGDALSEEDIQNIVMQALENRAMMEAAPKEEIIFGDLNWPSALLQNRIAQYLVEKGYGYPTDVKFGATLPLFQGIRRGDTHVAMEIWLPNQNDTWNEARTAGEVVSVGLSLGKDWQSAFVIPAYLQEQYPELDSVEDLKEEQYKSLFATPETGGKARLVSCIIGWSCELVNAAQVKGYGLDDHIHIVNPGDGAALNADLYGAYERQEPWLGYMWGTADPPLKLDLVRLEEPAYSDECWFTTRACAYQDATILIAVTPDLLARAPDVIQVLRAWDFNIDLFKEVVAWQDANDTSDVKAAALWWLNSKQDVWGDWVTSEAAESISIALAAGEIPDGWPQD